jgi:predicted membrane-bound spermidine synthase
MPLVFFASGFAALIYQVVWQRVLFAAFGVNIEAVTVVVTAFLAGLGLGSLAGGRLAQGTGAGLLRKFAAIELCIGLFGFLSISVFQWFGHLSTGLSSLGRGVTTAVLVTLPTSFMGATLPLLVAYLVRTNGNVGQSVGLLYFVNTAGSAAAAFAAVLVLLRQLGEQGSCTLAAGVNLAVAGFVLLVPARNPGS